MTTHLRRRYPGVRSFEERDAAQFFGRPRAADELLLRVLSVRLLLQFAPSGVGKTSLLQAGLFPRLRPYGYFPFTVRLNRSDETLAAAIRRSMAAAATAFGLPDPVIPEDAPDTVALLAGTQLWGAGVSLLTPVLVFDQFEEVYTLRDEAFRQGFARDIGRLVGAAPSGTLPSDEPAASVKIIISLREEFLGRLEELAAEIPDLFQERLRLPPLSAQEARDAIVKPAALEGAGFSSPAFGFEPACVDELIDFIDGTSERLRLIEPLTLQLVCSRAEALVMARPVGGPAMPMLSLADFGDQEGLKKLVTEHFDRELARLGSAAEQRRARAMFETGLLDPVGKRLMLEEGEIQRDHRLERSALDILVEGRLLRREPRNDSLFYEISHDRMAEAIARQRKTQLPRWVQRSLAGAAVVIAGLFAGGLYVGQLQWKTQVALDESQRLYGLLLGPDLVERLREAGGNALGAMLQQIDTTQPAPGVSPEVSRLRLQGDLQLVQGTLDQARIDFQAAMEALDSAVALSQPATEEEATAVQVEQAQLLGRLGEVEGAAGRPFLARQHLNEAAELWGQILGGQARLTDALHAAELYTRLATLAMQLDDLPATEQRAADAVEQATFVWMEAHAEVDEDPDTLAFLRGRALRVLSEAMLVQAQIKGTDRMSALTAAAAMARESRQLRPFSALAIRQAALASTALGRYQGQVATRLEPLRELTRAARWLDQLTQSDPADLRARRDQAILHAVGAERVAVCLESPTCRTSVSDAAQLKAPLEAREAAATLQWLSSRDGENAAWRRDLIWVKTVQARLETAAGRDDVAVQLLDTAVAIYRESDRQRTSEPGSEVDPADVSLAALTLMQRFGPLSRQGQHTLADATVAQACKQLERLPEPARAKDTKDWMLQEQTRVLAELGSAAPAEVAQDCVKTLVAALDGPQQMTAEQSIERAELEARLTGLWYESSSPSEPGPDADSARRTERFYRSALRYAAHRPEVWLALSASYDELARDQEAAAADGEPLPPAELNAQVRPRGMSLAAASAGFAISQNTTFAVWAQRQRHDARLAMSYLLIDLDKLDEVDLLLRDVAVQARELAAADNPDPEQLVVLGDAYNFIGLMRIRQGSEGWEESLKAGMDAARRLIKKEPKVANHQAWLGWMHQELGSQLKAKERAEDAQDEFAEATALCSKALRIRPSEEQERKNAQECLDAVKAAQDG